MPDLRAPFPYFGGKRVVAHKVWKRLGAPTQYIEPFCGSAAMLLAAPSPASLEVVCDQNGFIANFWRATKYQPAEVALWADYPVSHVDVGAAHCWLMQQRESIWNELQDIEWPGNAKAAGRWLHGQCCWIGSGWCDWSVQQEWACKPLGQIPHFSDAGMGVQAIGKVPHVSDAGRGVQAIGRVPHFSDAGMGVQAIGKVPHVSDAGRGVQAIGRVPHVGNAGMGVQAVGKIPQINESGKGILAIGKAVASRGIHPESLLTSSGRTAWRWLHELADRLERVRVIHGDWSRCLNHHFGGNDTAVFLDPPYRAYEKVYSVSTPVADAVADWARQHPHLRIALCGHIGDYELPGWQVSEWSRGKLTYGGGSTTDKECIWYSPACLPEEQADLFAPVPSAEAYDRPLVEAFAEDRG